MLERAPFGDVGDDADDTRTASPLLIADHAPRELKPPLPVAFHVEPELQRELRAILNRLLDSGTNHGTVVGMYALIELVLRVRGERPAEVRTSPRSTTTAPPRRTDDRGTTRRCAQLTSRSQSAPRVRADSFGLSSATGRPDGRSRTPFRPAHRASRRAACPRRRKPARPPFPRARASRRYARARPPARKDTNEPGDAIPAGRSRLDCLPGSLR